MPPFLIILLKGKGMVDKINPAKNLRKSYITALLVIFLVSLVSQGIIQVTAAQNDDASRVINIAGRQRMLSQRIAKSALLLVDPLKQEEREEILSKLKEDLKIWQESNISLLEGNRELGLRGKNSPEVMKIYRDIQPHYLEMNSALEALIKVVEGKNQTNPRTLTESILLHETPFVEGMNAITFQHDFETQTRLILLRRLQIGLFLIMIIVLILVLLLIFRPYEEKLDSYFNELNKTMLLLEKQASFDEMTGVYNKQSGTLFLGQEIERSYRSKAPVTLCFIDLDGLKKINDTYGHQEGDRMIKAFSNILKQNVRSSDVTFRYGGDEFVLILTGAGEQAARTIQRIENSVRTFNERVNKPWTLSFSSGLASYRGEEGTSGDELLKLADKRMYTNKMKKKESKNED